MDVSKFIADQLRCIAARGEVAAKFRADCAGVLPPDCVEFVAARLDKAMQEFDGVVAGVEHIPQAHHVSAQRVMDYARPLAQHWMLQTAAALVEVWMLKSSSQRDPRRCGG